MSDRIRFTKTQGVDMDEGFERWNLYREAHKAIRFALFNLTALAGATDAEDAKATIRLLGEWADVRLLLEAHHDQEDEFFDPLIQLHVPHLRDELESAHDLSDDTLVSIGHRFEHLASATTDANASLLQSLHLDLSDFLCCYLPHLRFEEERIMPELNAVLSDEQLAEVSQVVRANSSDDLMCVFIRYLAPATNPVERRQMLQAIEASRPEIYERCRSIARAGLGPDEWILQADRLDRMG